MKKMSEIFELPVSGKIRVYVTAVIEDADVADAEKAAAHAINHVDALADALELMVQHNWHPAQFRREAESVAAKALAAYRGEK
jgi:hypothetical protein